MSDNGTNANGFLSELEDLCSARDFETASALLNQAIRADPQFFLYHERLAEVHLAASKPDLARAALLEALKLAPEADWLHEMLYELRRYPRPGVFAGRYDLYPDLTGKRQAEGGRRLAGVRRKSRSDAPLVTIVTAVYDNADSFQRCMDSVRAQSHDNVEYIVIDGGSPEATLELIRANDDIIDYYVSEPDDGIYSAMNKGIELATGDYICLLNSDDYYDPDFVTETLRAARAGEVTTGRRVDIVYTDYHVGSNLLKAQEIDEGLLFGHLHVCHNTFLTHRDAYDRVGPYDEDFRIVSDAVWMRKALQEGLHYQRLAKPLFTLTEGGLSSGNTEAQRKLFIAEAGRSYQLHFPQLSQEEAEEIYLFRFNKQRVPALTKIARNHAGDVGMLRALRGYVEHCFRDRGNFRLAASDIERFFPEYCDLADLLDVETRCFQIETAQGPLQEVLDSYDAIIARRKPSARRTLLHFISVFSAPPETFVYDLLQRLEADAEYDNFILFEHPQLREERPYDKALAMHWPDFHPLVGARIYKYIAEALAPDAVIAHFALNEWKWAQRTRGLGLDIPTVSMCHGIDAFSMRNNPDYKNYLVEDFSARFNTAFTAVSEYLANELRSHGVPKNKITLVHNTVNPRFFAYRKSSGFYDRKRRLELLSIGRLVPLKGHEFAIRALAQFCETCTRDVRLTIVYGHGADRLKALHELAAELGIDDKVAFEAFVDFNQTPDFFAGFDCFLFPSIYSADELKRSESFGLAVLEAIAAGLPVITSDAGGLPEVVGNEETPFARVVPHGDAGAIAEALAEMWQGGRAFADNRNYAEARLARFSEARQIALVGEVIDRVCVNRIDAALFSSSTIQGAGYAAFRLHKGLRQTRVRSRLFTTVSNHSSQPDVKVVPHPSGDSRGWAALQSPPKPGLTIMSYNQTHISSEDLLRMVEPYDLVNLHWTARFLSAENLATLTWSDKPVVLTIRDMLPLTGGCHCFHGCTRWQDSCDACPQIDNRYIDFPRKVSAAKRTHFNFDNLTLVALSNVTRAIVAKTPGFRDCRIETIPNSIELDIFRPYNQANRRRDLGLPLDRPIIAYLPSYSSEVKGYRELLEAFEYLKKIDPDLDPFILLVGGETPATGNISFDMKALGYVHDPKRLAWAYAAADLVVVPSLEETFSNTAAEAISCGTPVVGFRTGAIPDLAINGKTGHTSEVGDTLDLAKGLSEVLRASPSMRQNCRTLAETMLPFMKQAERYEALFAELVANRAATPVSWQPQIFEHFGAASASLLKIANDALVHAKGR